MPATHQCHVCRESFRKDNLLQTHARQTGHEAYRCGNQSASRTVCCAFTSSESSALLNHVRIEHRRQKSFQCPCCPLPLNGTQVRKSFKIETALVDHFNHMHRAATLTVCHICIDTFRSERDLLQHEKEQHPPADVHANPVGSPPQLHGSPGNSSKETPQTQSSACVVPTLASPPWLPGHPEVISWVPYRLRYGIPRSTWARCKACDKSFTTKAEEEAHYRDTKIHPSCCLCWIAFKTPQEFSAHMSSDHILRHADAHCLPCDRYFGTIKTLREHVSNVHTDGPEIINLSATISQYVGAAFVSEAETTSGANGAFMEDSSGIYPANAVPGVDPGLSDGTYSGGGGCPEVTPEDVPPSTPAMGRSCSICMTWFSATFKDLSDIAHTRPSVGCLLCTGRNDERNNVPQDMLDHWSTHANCPLCALRWEPLALRLDRMPPRATCRACGVSFLTKREEEVHHRDTAAHPSCCLCFAAFKTPKEFHNHMTIDHIMRHARAHCLPCDKYFRALDILEAHVQAVHLNGCPGFYDHSSAIAQYRQFTTIPNIKDLFSGEKSDEEYGSGGPSQTLPRAEPVHVGSRDSAAGYDEDDFSEASDKDQLETTAPVIGGAESTPSHQHARSVPDDWECTSSVAVSDIGSWSDMSGSDVARSGTHSTGRAPTDSSGDAKDVSCEVVNEDPTASSTDTTPDSDRAEDKAATLQIAAPQTLTPPTAPAPLSCRVCRQTPSSPTVTMCGHLFCRGCIISALADTLSCPACSRQILVKVDV